MFADGKEIAAAETLTRVTGTASGNRQPAVPETIRRLEEVRRQSGDGRQVRHVLRHLVLREGDKYRMWLSWRPKKSVALVESTDGIHWSEPPQIVLGPRPETGWEDDINRPVVVKRADGYHLWYTGQAKGHSSIGYATSPDGITWKRMSDKPVLAATSRGRRSPSCARTCSGTSRRGSSACGIPAASRTSRTPSATPPAPTG